MTGRNLLIVTIATAAAGLFWWGTGFQPAPGPPARADDCLEIGLWNNGLHTDLTFPVSYLPAAHPLRQIDPTARYILIGWGDEVFFRSDGTDILLGLKALFPGGSTTMHIVTADVPVAQVYRPKELQSLGVSRAGMDALARRLTDTLVLGAAGGAQVVAPGHGGPRSWFLQARGAFDLFQLCNQWTARSLRVAGVRINAAFLYTGDMVAGAARGAAPQCQPEPGVRNQPQQG